MVAARGQRCVRNNVYEDDVDADVSRTVQVVTPFLGDLIRREAGLIMEGSIRLSFYHSRGSRDNDAARHNKHHQDHDHWNKR